MPTYREGLAEANQNTPMLGTFASVLFIVFSPLPRLRSVAEVAHADRA